MLPSHVPARTNPGRSVVFFNGFQIIILPSNFAQFSPLPGQMRPQVWSTQALLREIGSYFETFGSYFSKCEPEIDFDYRSSV
jgi:hypothetical protein